MFLLRSAFWLTAAFLVMRPDVEIDTGALSASAAAAGQQFVADQVLGSANAMISREAGSIVRAAMTSTANPSIDLTMQDSSISPVPFPRPRPDWMG